MSPPRRIPRPWPAVQPERHLHSPLGDQRERAVTASAAARRSTCAPAATGTARAPTAAPQQAIADEIPPPWDAADAHPRYYAVRRRPRMVWGPIGFGVYVLLCLDSPLTH